MSTWIHEHTAEVLGFAQLTFLWVLAQYLLPEVRGQRREEARFTRGELLSIGVISLALAALSAWTWRGNFAISIFLLCACVGVAWMRLKVPAAYVAECELAWNAGVLAAIALFVARVKFSPVLGTFFREEHQAAILLTAGVVLLSIRTGTYVVRGILNKVGTLPPLEKNTVTRGEFEIDVKEYNRGRLIGNIERVLLVVMVAAHSYEALGFLIAAKGLIRSRELENRSWAEYFLVGTLASTLVALIAGLTVQAILKLLW